MADDLGARLLRAGLVTRDQLSETLAVGPQNGGALVAALVDRGVPEDALAGFFLAEGFGPVLEGDELESADPGAVKRLPGAMAGDLLALPVRATPAGLLVAMAAPSDRHAVKEISRIVGGDVLPTTAMAGDLARAIERAYPDAPARRTDRAADRTDSEPPALELVRKREKVEPAPAAPPAPSDAAWGKGAKGAKEENRAALGPRLVSDDDEPAVPLVRTKPSHTPAHGVALPREEVPDKRARVITKSFAKPDPQEKPEPRPPKKADPRMTTGEYAPMRPAGKASASSQQVKAVGEPAEKEAKPGTTTWKSGPKPERASASPIEGAIASAAAKQAAQRERRTTSPIEGKAIAAKPEAEAGKPAKQEIAKVATTKSAPAAATAKPAATKTAAPQSAKPEPAIAAPTSSRPAPTAKSAAAKSAAPPSAEPAKSPGSAKPEAPTAKPEAKLPSAKPEAKLSSAKPEPAKLPSAKPEAKLPSAKPEAAKPSAKPEAAKPIASSVSESIASAASKATAELAARPETDAARSKRPSAAPPKTSSAKETRRASVAPPPKEAPAPEPARASRPGAVRPDHERWDLDPPREVAPDEARASKLASRANAEMPAPKAVPPEIGSVLAAMRAARDRDDVVRLAVEGAVSVSRSAVFLALRKGVLKGWDGAGAGISRDAIRNLWIPTTSASTFKKVVDERSVHIGPYGTAIADGLFRAAVASRGGEVAIHPVVVADKVVGILAVDDLLPGPLARHRIDLVAHAVADAFKRIISEKKT
jgi:hypothetical protein